MRAGYSSFGLLPAEPPNNSPGGLPRGAQEQHTDRMDQLYLRCEDRLAAWGESFRSCCDAFERTCCGALIARKKTRAALICGLDGAGKTTVLCCVPAVRRNLEKWARKNGVDELHTAPTCGHQLVEFAMTRSATARCLSLIHI